jgi:hypothetical protein
VGEGIIAEARSLLVLLRLSRCEIAVCTSTVKNPTSAGEQERQRVGKLEKGRRIGRGAAIDRHRAGELGKGRRSKGNEQVQTLSTKNKVGTTWCSTIRKKVF